jgi:hypothetical protein
MNLINHWVALNVTHSNQLLTWSQLNEPVIQHHPQPHMDKFSDQLVYQTPNSQMPLFSSEITSAYMVEVSFSSILYLNLNK